MEEYIFCVECKTRKPPSSFSPCFRTDKYIKYARCRSCKREYTDTYYTKNQTAKQTYHREKARQRKRDIVAILGGKCIHCGYNEHIAGLEAHHVDPSQKEFSITQNINTSWERILKELEKCVLLCSICHNIEHWDTPNSKKTLAEKREISKARRVNKSFSGVNG